MNTGPHLRIDAGNENPVAQVREVEASALAWMERTAESLGVATRYDGLLAVAGALTGWIDTQRRKPAREPVPVAQDWHVRHLGAGLLAQYHGDEYVRDIGGTAGWDFKDRDEFIARYNDHADHARIVAEEEQRTIRMSFKAQALQTMLTQAESDLRATEASLAACRADAERLDYIERTFSGMTNRERYLPVQMVWGKGAMGRTLREACDKYMKRDGALPLAGEVANG